MEIFAARSMVLACGESTCRLMTGRFFLINKASTLLCYAIEKGEYKMVCAEFELNIDENGFIKYDKVRDLIKTPDKIETPDDVCSFMEENYHLSKKTEEFVYIICTDAKTNKRHVFQISHGTLGNSYMGATSIIKRCLITNARNLFLIHNHPSGDTTPSKDDIDATLRLNDKCKEFEIMLCDHIIIGEGTFTSLRREDIIT